MFEFIENEIVELKGFLPMQTYWLTKNNNKSLWELIDRPRGERICRRLEEPVH